MSKQFNFMPLTLIFSLVLIGSAHAEKVTTESPLTTAPTTSMAIGTDPSVEMNLLMEAAGKVTEVLTAQLDGDKTKIEKSSAEAIAIYDKVLAENPNNVKAINGRAAIKEIVENGKGADDYKKAIDISTQAISLNKTDANAYYNRAAAYRGLHLYSEARTDYQEAIKLNPNRPDWATSLKAMEIEAK